MSRSSGDGQPVDYFIRPVSYFIRPVGYSIRSVGYSISLLGGRSSSCCQVKGHVVSRAGEHVGHMGPRAGEHVGRMGARNGEDKGVTCSPRLMHGVYHHLVSSKA